ncbi:hypothetical protein JCM10450v2_003231 [Rhodotorula kratochvilovae]
MRSAALLLPLALIAALVAAHPTPEFYDAYRASFSPPSLDLHRRSSSRCHRRVRASAGGSSAGVAKVASTADAGVFAVSTAHSAHSTAARTTARVFGSLASTRSSAAATSSSSSSGSRGGGKGLFGVSDSTCGASGATRESSKDGGPNGSEEWLNCGISKGEADSGWTPPTIHLSQIRTLDLESALSMPNSVYASCKPYKHFFEKYGAQHGIPPILLAAFAMQESSCDPAVRGDNGGAFGLMQITEDKCGDAPNGHCADPEYNVKTAAAYFAKVLEEHDESLLLALGSYNGWYKDLSYKKAIAARSYCCECQQNLDYHQQMLNGWLLGLDGSKLGTMRNLDVC